MDFAGKLSAAMAARGMGVRALARRMHCDPALISRLASGKQHPSAAMARLLDDAFAAGGELLAAARQDTGGNGRSPRMAAADDEIAAIELARQATLSTVGESTVSQLERAVDDMALAYPRTPPRELLSRIQAHLGYVTGLLDGRMTLAEHRRLLISMGWLSLLSATCLIDLHRFPAAAAHLRAAAQLARETGHAEIAAWCLETRAWQLLTEGNFRRAVDLSLAAQRTAPKDGSAFIQATGQEARAWARLGAGREARDALARAEALVAPLPMPDRPEHHYQYDPAKSDAYTATTLAWLGDPAAAGCARGVLGRLEDGADGGPPRPRRAASARLDLALALTASSELDEATSTALTAVTSGLLVPSNYWRAQEIITVISHHGVPAAELREAYREHCSAPLRALPST